MTFTDTVSSLAHDAVSAASELGSHAAERSADAVTSVAAAAENLATSLSKSKVAAKIPAVRARRRRKRMLVIVGAGAAVVGVAVLAKKRGLVRKPIGSPQDLRESPVGRDAVGSDSSITANGAPITDSVMG